MSDRRRKLSPSPRARLILGFATANLALVIIATAVWLNRPASPPQIQGVLLPDSRPVQAFSLIDHNNREFTNKDLIGQWHLVSYGFTTCPDVCPTTLSTLSRVTAMLESDGREPLNVLFYSVDHRRDTVDQLASYMPFFDESFLGLTHRDDSANPHLPFEQSLGIFALLTPAEDSTAQDLSYQVSHGVTLFLLNPRGELQAIFEPGEDALGAKVFDPDKVYRDYLQVRQYVDPPILATLGG